MIGSVDVKEFLDGFLGESDEHLRTIRTELAELEARPGQPNPRAARALFRALHTLKGLSGMMGVEPLVELAHAMESVVRTIDAAGGVAAPNCVDPLISGVSTLETQVRAVGEGKPVPPPPEDLLQHLEELATTASAQAPAALRARVALPAELFEKLSPAEATELEQALARGEHAYALDFVPSPARAAAGMNITSLRERVASLGQIVRVLPVAVPRTAEAPGALKFTLLLVTRASSEELSRVAGVPLEEIALLGAAGPQAKPESPPPDSFDAREQSGKHGVVRVSVGRLDATIEELAGVAVFRSRLVEQTRSLAETGTDVRALLQLLDEQARALRRLRSSILSLRMVRLREALEPLGLIVRGLRSSAGKSVRLQIDVGEAELDKAVAERIFPALVHLVRNAIDHGIELPAERVRSGKPEQGTVRVFAAATSSTHVAICIEDDGAGVDAERVRQKTDGELLEGDRALLDVLTRPGFSTRDNTTATSGRGFGMDIVRQAIDALGGELSLENEPGRGARFQLSVPLTVAMVATFAFEAGQQRFLVPIGMVDEICEVSEGSTFTPPGAHGPSAVRLLKRRGEAVPIISLSRMLGISETEELEPKALVVGRKSSACAFSVRRLLGQHEVLIRPVTDPLVQVPGVTGSADLGDGRPTLVMDLLALSSSLSEKLRPEVRPS